MIENDAIKILIKVRSMKIYLTTKYEAPILHY